MTYHAKVTDAYAVEFPEELVRELELMPGGSLVIEREDGKLVIKSYMQIVRDVQAEVRRLSTCEPGSSIVDELLADRRREARQEDENYRRWSGEHG